MQVSEKADNAQNVSEVIWPKINKLFPMTKKITRGKLFLWNQFNDAGTGGQMINSCFKAFTSACMELCTNYFEATQLFRQ